MQPDSDRWTMLRKEVRQWFEDRAPSFVDGYCGAVELLHTQAFPARVHFICHAVRDIYRLLPATLGLETHSRPQEVFPGMVMHLVTLWDRYPPVQMISETNESAYSLTPPLYKYCAKIVNKSKHMGTQPSIGARLASALYRSQERQVDEFVSPWIIRSFDEEYDFFVRRAHLADALSNMPTDDGLAQHFEVFEKSFHSLVGPYFSGKEVLDDILQDTNAIAN